VKARAKTKTGDETDTWRNKSLTKDAAREGRHGAGHRKTCAQQAETVLGGGSTQTSGKKKEGGQVGRLGMSGRFTRNDWREGSCGRGTRESTMLSSVSGCVSECTNSPTEGTRQHCLILNVRGTVREEGRGMSSWGGRSRGGGD